MNIISLLQSESGRPRSNEAHASFASRLRQNGYLHGVMTNFYCVMSSGESIWPYDKDILYHLPSLLLPDLAPFSLFGAILHGIGHGMLMKSIYSSSSYFSDCSPMHPHANEILLLQLNNALNLCNQLQTKYMANDCAGGSYHTFHEWSPMSHKHILLTLYHCRTSLFPAACFLRLSHTAYKSDPSLCLNASFLHFEHLRRACIFAASNFYDPLFIDESTGSSLEQWCVQFVDPSASAEMESTHLLRWEACVTGLTFHYSYLTTRLHMTPITPLTQETASGFAHQVEIACFKFKEVTWQRNFSFRFRMADACTHGLMSEFKMVTWSTHQEFDPSLFTP